MASKIITSDKLSTQSIIVAPEHVPFESISTELFNLPDRRANSRGFDRRKRPRAANERKINYWEVEPDGNRSRPYMAMKRCADIAGALVLLVLFGPVMLATLAILTITTHGKPVFKQQRVGLCGKLFWMYKFRTMIVDAEKIKQRIANEKSGPVFKNRRDPRITSLGRILRKFSVDEMPQVFNVFKGDMTLVGPRPPIESEVLKYQNWQLRRLSVKPGLTCIWQVSGRSEIEFEDWVRLDLRYVNNQDLYQDLLLLAKTPKSVITGKGAY